MNIKLKLRPDAGWLDPSNAGRIFEGIFIRMETTSLPDFPPSNWIILEHLTEEYTNLWGETHKMWYSFRTDIVEILEGQDVIERYMGNLSSN